MDKIGNLNPTAFGRKVDRPKKNYCQEVCPTRAISISRASRRNLPHQAGPLSGCRIAKMDKASKPTKKSALKTNKKNADSTSRISDPRFASFETDPRFKLPSKKHSKTTIDKRFSRMLKDDEFLNSSKVDRYGRKVQSDAKKKALQRLYREEGEDEDEEEDREEDVEVDADEVVQRELRKAHQKVDPARRGGFSESESDSDSESDEDDEEGGVDLLAAGDMQRFQDQQVDVETGEVTNRIAIVNLDWDYIKSTDLFALFSSFLPAESGRVEKVSVYPSEFGKERMQQEEIEGPPKNLFKDKDVANDDDSGDSDEDEDEKIKKELIEEGDDEDFDSDALRKYQLDRLRYYYAVMVCSSPSAAQKIYEATDGTEFQASSNFLDLRFVPDDVTFDDEPRDECTKMAESYKPVEFVTNALQSSKVKLTWDMHPEEVSRKDAVQKAFSGSRADLQENDLRAYLASDTEDDDDNDENDGGNVAEGEPKLSKKELARKKMREALGLAEESETKSSKHGPVGGMEITFTSALSDTKKPKKDEAEETTLEKYVRKERERKEQKRQMAKAKREGHEVPGSDDAESDEDEPAGDAEPAEDLGFDDPFFKLDEPSATGGKTSKSAIRKEERRKKREAREAEEAASAAQKAQLTKVMAEDADENQAERLDHFDMNDIVKAEKLKRKKGKGKSKSKNKNKEEAVLEAGTLQQDFNMDVEDDRFKAVFENHEFAIDPSNPKFKGTEGMKQLLEEGRKKRRGGDGEERKSKKSRR